jgi:two-component system sensor histidine kinase UhpB
MPVTFSKCCSKFILYPLNYMESASGNITILVIEDNPSDFYLLEQMLSSSRLKLRSIYHADRLSQAIDIIHQKEIGLILLDLSLPDSFGIDTFLSIKSLAQKIPVIILTGLSDTEMALEALKQNAQDYLVKGDFNANLLVKSIEYSIERKKSEENILASEEKYRQMFYQNPLPMWINEEDSLRILEVNDAAIHCYGYDRTEFLKLTVKDILSDAEDILEITSARQAKFSKHRKRSGEPIVVELSYYPIHYFGRTAMQAQANDITEKIRLEKELNLQKQQMIEAVLNAQEQERRKIGAELHDNINQVLTAIKLNLGLAQELPADSPALIDKSLKTVSMAIEEIRKLSRSFISSGNIKELGLIDSIEELINDLHAVKKIRIELKAESLDETTLSEEQKITIYRIIQEQFNNILKYAEASLVNVCLQSTPEQIHLLIADDGNGFDPAVRRKGVGITNMISRAELFNGKVKIDSAPGNGCRLEVVLNAKVHFPQEAQ